MYNPYGYGGQYGPQMPAVPSFSPGPIGGLGMYQNPAQQPAQPAMQAQTMPTVMQVQTIKQVEQAPVPPGGKALVMVANAPVIAMKVADNMGIATTDYYRIERFDPEAAQAPQSGDFVTRAEFQQAMETIAARLTADPQPEKEATA